MEFYSLHMDEEEESTDDLIQHQIEKLRKFDHEFDLTNHNWYMNDLITYSLSTFGHFYTLSSSRTEQYRRYFRFHPQIGDALLQYRARNFNKIKQDILNYLPMNDHFQFSPEGIETYMHYTAERIFTGGNFIQEYFVFSAFVMELGILCVASGQYSKLMTIMNKIEHLYQIFLRRRICASGGWNCLHRYAVRYQKYGNEPCVNIN